MEDAAIEPRKYQAQILRQLANYRYQTALAPRHYGKSAIYADDYPLSRKEPMAQTIQVGDRVRCIGNPKRAPYEAGHGWEEGLVFTVTRVRDYTKQRCYFGGKDTKGVYEAYLELAPKPAPRLWRVLDTKNNRELLEDVSDMKIGGAYELRYPHPDGTVLRDGEGDTKLLDANGNWHYVHDIEPVDDNNIPITNEGDTMSDVKNNPLQALKEVDLDADTRLLREMDFEHTDGTPRSNAVAEVQRRNWLAVRATVANDLRTAIANEATDQQAESTPAGK